MKVLVGQSILSIVLLSLISIHLQSTCAQETVDKSQVNRDSKFTAAVLATTNKLYQVFDPGSQLLADTSGFQDNQPTSPSTVALSDHQVVEHSNGAHDNMPQQSSEAMRLFQNNIVQVASSSEDVTVSQNQRHTTESVRKTRDGTSKSMHHAVTSENPVDSSTPSATDSATPKPNNKPVKSSEEESTLERIDGNRSGEQQSLRFKPEHTKEQFVLDRMKTALKSQSRQDKLHSEPGTMGHTENDVGHENVFNEMNVDYPSQTDDIPWKNIHGVDKSNLTESEVSTGGRKYLPPIDYFRCGRCSCHKLPNSNVHVDCRLGNDFKRWFAPIPESLPENMEYFDLSHNRVGFFGFVLFDNYPLLSSLILSHNGIAIIKNRTCNQRLNIRDLDLSYNKIYIVQDDSFSCLPKLRTLNLHNNRIKQLSKLMFSGLDHLEHLDVSNNELREINVDSFHICSHLLTLRLNRNKYLTYGKTQLVPELFRSLTFLQELHIQGFHASSYSYPILALKELTSLETLYVDGVADGHFDDDLEVLRNLTTVNIGIGGYCVMKKLPKSYFRGLLFVTTIRIYGCEFNTISPQAFDSNKLLTDLNFTHVSYDFDSMFEILSGIQQMPITSLTLNNLYEGLKRSPCRHLSADHAQYLYNLTRLEKLSLDNNQIANIGFGFLSLLPNELKHLSLRKNALSYLQTVVNWHDAHTLNNLEVLKEDYQNHGHLLGDPDDPEIEGHFCKSTKSKTPTGNGAAYSKYRKKDTDLDFRRQPRTLPKLKVYTAVQSFNFGRQFLRNKVKYNKVKLYNMSNSFMADWGSKTLSPWVEIADVSNNFCDVLSMGFLMLNNSLKEFHASGNFLSAEFANDFSGDKLSRFINVEYIDLAMNHINELPRPFFRGLKSIKAIDLSNNNIKSFNVTMSHMTSLVFLNFKRNSITWISRETRNDMDTLPNITIDLTSNPLPCTCEGLELLIWLATTRVKLISQDYLQCEDKNKNTRYIGDLRLAVATLQRQCASKAFLVLAASFSAVAFLLIASAVWIFRNRWWLYYMKNIMITKMFGYKAEDGDQAQQYWYDAYIHYGKQDAGFVMGECLQELEVKRGHKLCVEHRDFVLGSIMPCTITSAISRSRLTVPVITPEFWSGEWSEYGVQMATMESIHTKRDVLHLLIYRPVDLEDMPRNLLKIHNDNAFSEYPPEDCREDVKTAFWDAMSRAIGHIEPTVAPEEPDE